MGSWPSDPTLALKGTCPVLLLSLPNPLETFPRCTYGITVPALKRKQLKPCYNSLMLTSEWRDYPPLQKATCLFNADFTCLKVNLRVCFPPYVSSWLQPFRFPPRTGQAPVTCSFSSWKCCSQNHTRMVNLSRVCARLPVLLHAPSPWLGALEGPGVSVAQRGLPLPLVLSVMLIQPRNPASTGREFVWSLGWGCRTESRCLCYLLCPAVCPSQRCCWSWQERDGSRGRRAIPTVRSSRSSFPHSAPGNRETGEK